MEPMRIEIGSLSMRDQWVHAYARASAKDADIRLTVRFPAPSLATVAELHEMARDEVLRYVDPA
jgi:hypothetical protein